MKILKKHLALILSMLMIAATSPTAIYASPSDIDKAAAWDVTEEAPGPEAIIEEADEISADPVTAGEADNLTDTSAPVIGENFSEESPLSDPGGYVEESAEAVDEITAEYPANGPAPETAGDPDEVNESEELTGVGVPVGEDVIAVFNSSTGILNITGDGTLSRNWLSMSGVKGDSIKEIHISGGYNSPLDFPEDSSFLFFGLPNLKKISLWFFSTSNMKNASFMFYYCKNLTSLELTSISGYFDTYNVTNMMAMFAYCESLTDLSLSIFNTKNVTNMSYMFYNCTNLRTLDLGCFDMRNVTDCSDMFTSCKSLKLLGTPKKTSCLIDLPITLYNRAGIEHTAIPVLSTSLILAKNKELAKGTWVAGDCVTGKLNSSTGAVSFYSDNGTLWNNWRYCDTVEREQIKSINVAYGTVHLPEDSGEIFSVTFTQFGAGCYSNLTTLDLSGFNTSKVTKMNGMFLNCSSLTNLNLSSFNTSKVTDMSAMFSGCSSLTNLDLSSFDTSSVTNTGNMFEECIKLHLLKTPKKIIAGVTSLPGTMYNASGKSYTIMPATSKSIVLRSTKKGFSDVRDPDHAYYMAIYWAADAGITKGYSDGTFGINRNCTRGEMMMFLWRYAGKPSPTTASKSPFKDVPTTHTFYKAILWGSQKGITKGYSDGTFGINRNVSRGECMMFLWRLKNKPTPKAVATAPFPDVPKSHVFYNAVLWGYQKKITTGFTSGTLKGKFGVNENCSRGQIVTFLYRARVL